jgi:ABC-type nitrate/sulfonate/bicarbonate transport system substrate-binding protein
MNTFWKALGTGLTKAAIWALEHPDQVIAIASKVKEARK